MEDGEAGGGQNGFQHLPGLLNAISSQSAMRVGGRWSSWFKGFESEQLWAGYAEGSRLFYDTRLFFILACLYDWEQTRLIVTKVKSPTGSLV